MVRNYVAWLYAGIEAKRRSAAVIWGRNRSAGGGSPQAEIVLSITSALVTLAAKVLPSRSV